MGSSFVIQDGKLLARNFQIKGNEYIMLAKGGIGFDKSLDLAVTLRLKSEFSSDIIRDFDLAKYLANDRGEIEVPFKLGGTLDHRKVRVDSDFVNTVLNRALQKQGGNIFEKFLKDLGGRNAPADTTRKP
jgi:hypothetical protein